MEECSTLNSTQSCHEGLPQSTETPDESNNEDMYKFANYNKDRRIDYCHESPGYAAINRAKHSLRIESSVENSVGDELFSPGYDIVGGQEVANKVVIMAIEQENPLLHTESQKRSPSPVVYAKVNKDKKKKNQQDHSVACEERERSLSPEYSQVENINKHAKDNIIVNQENQEDEQQYYHNLEKPEEHGCSGNNIKEIVYTSEHSLNSKHVV
jgi:hypothetical protein